LITWTSEPLVPVLGFKVFLSPPSTFVAEVVASSGSEYQATLVLDTALGSFTNVEVFAFSALGTQSLPASGALSDVSAQAAGVFLLFLSLVGCPISWHKNALGSQNLWLGYQVHMKKGTARLPKEKLA
ncbi:unnamed protein product, partial [Effrenium voratum]